MTPVIAGLFTTAMELPAGRRAFLILPLCLSIAVVYKTLRVPHIREIPLASIVLWITIVIAMYAVGVGLWAIFSLLV